MAMIKKDIGAYSAYAIAVKHGYEGTEAEWVAAQEQARVDSEAAAKATQAAQAAQTAKEAAEQAQTGAQTAKTGAETARTDAQSAKTAAEKAAQEAKAAQTGAETAQGIAEAAADAISGLETRLKSGALADAELHLGFYLDENGDLCQKED